MAKKKKSQRGDITSLLDVARATPGWRVEQRQSSHWVVYPANKDFAPITLPSTPSDWRAFLNARAALRRAGLEV